MYVSTILYITVFSSKYAETIIFTDLLKSMPAVMRGMLFSIFRVGNAEILKGAVKI